MQSTLIIALEGVLLDFFGEFISFVNKKTGKQLLVEDIKNYDVRNLVGGSGIFAILIEEFISENRIAFMPAKYAGIGPMMQELVQQCRVVAVSSMPSFTKVDIISALVVNGIEISDLVFSVHRHEIMFQYPESVYIDDNPLFLRQVCEGCGGHQVYALREAYNHEKIDELYCEYPDIVIIDGMRELVEGVIIQMKSM